MISRANRLFWQIHLLQERVVARVAFEIIEQPLTDDLSKDLIPLRVRAIKPLKRAIRIASIRVRHCHKISLSIRKFGNERLKRFIRFRLPAGCLQCDRQELSIRLIVLLQHRKRCFRLSFRQ